MDVARGIDLRRILHDRTLRLRDQNLKAAFCFKNMYVRSAGLHQLCDFKLHKVAVSSRFHRKNHDKQKSDSKSRTNIDDHD